MAIAVAVADALEARFNPVAVRGEITGFSRASSGHCYFSLKDAQGQIRCAMFRRAAGLLPFAVTSGGVQVLRSIRGGSAAIRLPAESMRTVARTLAANTTFALPP